MENIVEKLHTLLLSNLTFNSPVLSGNMKAHIRENGDREIVIEAPFYDIKQWREKGVIVLTGATIYGKTDYAEWVNKIGAFGTHNKSEHWVNSTVLSVAQTIANEVGGVVINEL